MTDDPKDLLEKLDLVPSPSEAPSALLEELDLTSEAPRLRLQGARSKELYVNYERDLTVADLVALQLPRGVAPAQLQRIHSSHHSLARCIATGMKDYQAALITGYSPSRVSILKADPAFQALVADYQAEARSFTADLNARMGDMSLDAIEILHERLQSNPEGFSIPMLLDVVKAFADRTGHGPGSEVHLRVDQNFIDRPPRETFEEWERRRMKEIDVVPAKKLN